MGRPDKIAKFTAAEKAKFLQLLRNGSPKKWACLALGITEQTLENYRARAAAGEEPYASFIRDADEAQAGYVIERLRVIDADGIGAPTGTKRERGDYRAIAWILERLHPKDFAAVQKQEVTGKDGAPFEQLPAKVIIMPAKDPE